MKVHEIRAYGDSDLSLCEHITLKNVTDNSKGKPYYIKTVEIYCNVCKKLFKIEIETLSYEEVKSYDM